jgi:hypothetical protein
MKQVIAGHARLLAVATACVALGAGAGVIASAGAASSTPSHGSAGAHQPAHGPRAARHVRLLRRAVSGDLVVHTKQGFRTVSLQRGKVDSVSGSRLTLTEGTRKAAYRSVTVTIPSDARVRDNGKRASLSSVTAGQRVLVVRAPRRTFVIARTPASG